MKGYAITWAMNGIYYATAKNEEKARNIIDKISNERLINGSDKVEFVITDFKEEEIE